MLDKKYVEAEINKINKNILKFKNIRHKSLDYIFSKVNLTSGKKIRGLLLILVANSNGLKKNLKIYNLAAAIELLHYASLIHDDVIDDAEKRRGVLSLHKVLGKELSVLAGDYFFSLVTKIIFNEKNFKIFKIFIDAVNSVCKGAIDEIYNKNNIKLKENEYINIITQKTASLFQISSEIGSLLAKINSNDYENLKKFGLYSGIAFQIKDDILDITADEKELGKPTGSDIYEGKITLPLIKALKNARDSKKSEIKNIYKQKKVLENMDKIMYFIKNNNGIELAYKEAERYVNMAKKFVMKSKIKNKEALIQIADYMINRNF